MKGKLILIEGTDCSGKETQADLLKKRLEAEGHKVFKTSFPMYETPTGKIIGGPYLGKPSVCESFFEEGAVAVNPEVAGLYYVADRVYNIGRVLEPLKNGEIVILDRYMESNMAHQGSKIEDKKERLNYFNRCVFLEYGFYQIPKPDLTIFLHMPYEAACDLKGNRLELDQHESNMHHLKKAEATYVELVELYKWQTINCLNTDVYVDKHNIKAVEQIGDEVYNRVNESINEIWKLKKQR